MSSWTERATGWFANFRSSHNVQLAAVGIASGAVVGGGILAVQAANRRARLARLKMSINPDIEDHDSVADHIAEYKIHPFAKEFSPEQPVPHIDMWADGVETNQQQVEQDAEESHVSALASRAREGDYDEDLILEQLARNRVFLTDPGLAKLRSSFIVMVGLGGVGSHATAALARSGVGRIRLIDFDQVTLSSLNRHAVATLADVGTPKVHCLRRRLEQVTPWVQFDCQNELFQGSVAPAQLGPWKSDGQKPDFVIDAIDNIDSKVELLKYCHANGLKVISSMGAGCKSDPTRIFVGDISTSTDDPLSRVTRRRLKLLGVSSGIPVVFSTEKPAPGKAQLMPLPEDEFQKGQIGELGVLPDFRVRILPVLGTMPAVFGLCVANHIMLAISGYPHDYRMAKGREKMYDGILAYLQGCEERLVRTTGADAVGLRLPISQNDVGYLVDEVYRGRSVVSGLPTKLVLIRWRQCEDQATTVDREYEGQKYARLSVNELVCMTKEEATRHEREVLRGGKSPEETYSAAVLELVRTRMAEETHYAKYR